MYLKPLLIVSTVFIIATIGQISLGMNYTDIMFISAYLPFEIIMTITAISLWYLFLRKSVPIYFSKDTNRTFFITLPLLLVPISIVTFVILGDAKEINYSILGTVLLTSLFVGISEEIYFRVIAFGSLLSLHNTPRKSILLSALIFSLFHLTNLFSEVTYFHMIIQLINTFMMGVVFAYIYYKTKNIIYIIVIHFMWDFSIFTNMTYGSIKEIGAGMPILVIGYFIWAIKNTLKLSEVKK